MSDYNKHGFFGFGKIIIGESEGDYNFSVNTLFSKQHQVHCDGTINMSCLQGSSFYTVIKRYTKLLLAIGFNKIFQSLLT